MHRRVGIGIYVAILVVSRPAFVRGQVVQLPTVRTFAVQTSVLVPDRGAALLGGTTRNVVTPAGSRHTLRQSHVTARIIDLREMDAAVLAEARRRRSARASHENGLDNRAAYLSRHVGGRPGQGHRVRVEKRGPSATAQHVERKSQRLTYNELMHRGREAMSSGRFREAKQYFLSAASAGR